MKINVKIVNRGTYTSPKRAEGFVLRGFARIVALTDTGRITEIQMLEPAELESIRSRIVRERRDPVSGSFEWHPRPSAGFMVLQAQHTTK